MTAEQATNLAVALAPTLLPLLFRRGRDVYLRAWRWVAQYMPGAYMRVHRQLDAKVDEGFAAILKELRPNGGGSLCDKIDRIDRRGVEEGAKLRSLFSSQVDGQFETDATGRVTWANDALLRWAGQPAHVVLSRGWEHLVADQQRALLLSELQTAVADRRDLKQRISLRSITPYTDTGGGRVELIEADLRVTAIRAPEDASKVLSYCGSVRKRVTGEQPALPRVAGYMLPDDGA